MTTQASLRAGEAPEQCETPAAPLTPAPWAAPWRSSSASSSRCTCAELSGARGGRPSRDARRGPTGEQHEAKDHRMEGKRGFTAVTITTTERKDSLCTTAANPRKG